MSVLVSQFGLPTGLELPARYNIAPTQQVAALRQPQPADSLTRSRFGFTLLKWGLVPFWAKDPSIGNRMINARSETVAEKPSFRTSFKRRRCLVLADGYYEWLASGKQKQPYYIRRQDDQPFAIAGLWDCWDKGEQPLETVTILTTEANDLTRPIHDRMPVILEPPDHDLWLSDEQNPESLLPLLVPAASESLTVFPVSRLVNQPRNDDPQCILPIELSE